VGGEARVNAPRVTEPVPPPDGGPGGGGGLTPTSARRLAALGTVVIVLLGILIVRLWFLQVVGAQEFEARAVGNSVRTINIPAPRGNIVDRNGQVLAGSRLAWDIVALPQDLEGPEGDRTLRRIARVIGQPPAKLRRIMASGKRRAPYKSVVLMADIEDDVRLPLTEKIGQFPGIRLEPTFRRDYPYGDYLSHALGYVGAIPEEDIEERRRQGYRNDAIVGRDGLEQRYEEFLKGVDGERRVEVDAAGQPAGRGVISERRPKPGLDLLTTLDVNVQLALEDALREQVERRSVGGGGGGVVLDVETGAVVALASYPRKHPGAYSRGNRRIINKIQRNPRKVEINRALWAYPPASTFKPVTSIAALNAGYMTPETFLSSPKSVKLFGTPFGNFRQREQPDMQIRRALATSSDTFFYQVAATIFRRAEREDQREGHNKLYDWARELGLGQPTRIDIPGESPGVVPDREWKEANLPRTERLFDQWRPGDTINMGVGQGFLDASPIQMARLYATFLNGRRLLQPTVGWKVVDPTGRTVSDLAAGRSETQIRELGPGVLDAVLHGLRDATTTFEGTGWSTFGAVGGLVAGKTGTAETGRDRDHAWFVGFGPATPGSTPKYVAAVVVEYSGLGGEVAAPIVCRTMAVALSYDPKRCSAVSRPQEAGD
jgi:penicillin-binding protein 2